MSRNFYTPRSEIMIRRILEALETPKTAAVLAALLNTEHRNATYYLAHLQSPPDRRVRVYAWDGRIAIYGLGSEPDAPRFEDRRVQDRRTTPEDAILILSTTGSEFPIRRREDGKWEIINEINFRTYGDPGQDEKEARWIREDEESQR